MAIPSRSGAIHLERDPEKWIPVFGSDHAQNKHLEPGSDSIGTDKALSAKLRKTERSALPQSSSRPAPERRPAQASCAAGGPTGNPSEGAGQDLGGAREAQTPLDVEAAFGPFLDQLVAETVRLSDAQRQIGRGRVSAWRRSLSALTERLWRLESKIVRAAFHVG